MRYLPPVLKNIFLVAAVMIGAAGFVPAAEASVAKPGYSGKIISQSATEVVLKPGVEYSFNVKIQNTGTVTWNNYGSRFVSAYTYFPKYRKSDFSVSSWYRYNQPAKIKETSVAPGKTATMAFTMKAPSKPGVYDEGFWLASEDYSWIDGAQFKIKITVSDAKAAAVTPPPAEATPSGDYAGMLLLKSFGSGITMKGGESTKVTVGFKNLGTVIWQTRVLRMRGLTIADVVSLASADWPNAQEPSRVREPISPGNVGFFTFTIQAPPTKGTYNLPLKVVVDDTDVAGTEFDIPVTVTEDAARLPDKQIPATPVGNQPIIRVGLWNVPGGVVLLNSSPFSVVAPGGTVITTIPAGTAITVGFNRENRSVVISTPNGQFGSSIPVRFVPSDPTGLFQVPNFGGWDATLYVNQFRGTMELDYYAPNDHLWLIEELPMEEYVRGLAETSNSSNHEFQKALVVAARTYAYYVISIGGKYELFHVQPSAADQVYRAYGSETIRQNLVRAVEETAGQMVTYNGDVVVTPYFSRSDGRTRAWAEVWHGSKPWLVSVPTPHDVGKTLWGHGVGMSATDALGWANDGKTYDWILKYFYSGVEIKKIY